ncbi:MAG TPA: SDR family oxidoreductase [Polyangiaceae bacterium]|nr:SDR family oxidoreductase [Polyangiaceae bacterium]
MTELADAVLVIGFPGQRAVHITRELLDGGAGAVARLTLLVHPERLQEAQTQIASWSEAARERVTLEPADPIAIDWGLSGSRYRQLAECTRAIHAAYSSLDEDLPEATAEALHIGQARELVEFSKVASRLRTLVLYSSVFVSGDRTGRVLEDELVAGQGFRNPLERTLALTERMLADAGIQPWVLRSGHLIADSRTGAFARPTLPHLLLALAVNSREGARLPALPGSKARLAVTPVDYLARFGAWVHRLAEPGHTVHVFEPHGLSVGELWEHALERLGKLPQEANSNLAWARALLNNPAARLVSEHPRSFWSALTPAAEYDQTRYAELLARGAPPCPSLFSYLDPLLEQLRIRTQDERLSSEPEVDPPLAVT